MSDNDSIMFTCQRTNQKKFVEQLNDNLFSSSVCSQSMLADHMDIGCSEPKQYLEQYCCDRISKERHINPLSTELGEEYADDAHLFAPTP